MLDVLIVGGGPAGLSAALILGRCLRRVLVIDSGLPRNRFSQALHGYLTRDGISPQEFLEDARRELERYETVSLMEGEVIKAQKLATGFTVTLATGERFEAKKLLLATGVIDDVPKIDGINDLYGKSVHTCPYCDAWEVRGKQIAVYGKGARGLKLSLTMLTWSQDVILFTDGPSGLSDEEKERLERNGIKLKEEKIKYLRGEEGQLRNVTLVDGEVLPRDALFFNTESFIRSNLLDQLGCPWSQEEGVSREKYERTEVPGFFVAGNICRDVQLVIVAAAEGAQAAFGINSSLSRELLD